MGTIDIGVGSLSLSLSLRQSLVETGAANVMLFEWLSLGIKSCTGRVRHAQPVDNDSLSAAGWSDSSAASEMGIAHPIMRPPV